MRINIAGNTTLGSIQSQFSDYFPSLELEFFRNPYSWETPIRLLSPNLKVVDVTYNVQEGSLQLADDMTIGELADIFNDRFGLHIQVFHKDRRRNITDNYPLGRSRSAERVAVPVSYRR